MSFVVEATARQVEEKIRQLLKWGIPAPGGRSSSRGMPTSFLANALLAAQTDVDTILGQRFEADLEDSGKVQLSKALETLGRDALFKKVLDEAQRECDTYFTAVGRRKTAQGSPFKIAGDTVKKLEDERTELSRLAAESAAIEENVRALREKRDAAIERMVEATTKLAEVRDLRGRTKQREEAAVRLDEAIQSLGEIDDHAAHVARIAGEVAELVVATRAREEDTQKAASECAAAEAALRGAEEAHRTATGKEGARRRELRRAQLSEQIATLGATKGAADALRKTALNAQVIVLTCRPEDYLAKGDLPAGVPMRDLGGGAVRAIDAAAVVRRWNGGS